MPELENAIAIVGISLRLPGADDVDTFWNNLLDGKESIHFFKPDELDPSIPEAQRNAPNYVPAKGIISGIDEFDAQFFGISPAEARIMDPQQRLLLQHSWHALEDAGYCGKEPSVGVWLGTNWNRYYEANVLSNRDTLANYGEFNAKLANEFDFIASRISYKLGLEGPSISMATACSTSLVAVGQATRGLQNFECDLALAGGASVAVPDAAGYLYVEGSMLSRDGHCRSFDADAAGTTFNNGVTVVALRRLEDAIERKDPIYALIRGVGINNDGADKLSFSAPSIHGQAEAISEAIHDADIDPATVGFVEAHGTATPLGDPIEIEALKRAYQTPDNIDARCVVGSVKSNIGHVIHAAGAAGLIKGALAVSSGKIPGTVFFNKPNPDLRLDTSRFFVTGETTEWPQSGVRRAGVSSFGVGGTNAHAIVEQWQAPPRNEVSNGASNEFPIVLLSARGDDNLAAQSSSLAEYLGRATGSSPAIADVAYTLSKFRQHHPDRLAVYAPTTELATERLAKGRGRGVVSNTAVEDGRLVFAFSGQSSQEVGMGAALYQSNPAFRRHFDQACEIADRHLDISLRELMLAVTDAEAAKDKINQTRYTQPALVVIEYALGQTLIDMGYKPSVMLGHSIGEFVAACLAGVMNLEDTIRLACVRGRLMGEQATGSMLAVNRSEQELGEYLTATVSVAATNAPDLTVVAGQTADIEGLKSQLDQQDIQSTILRTSHAFHSWMMDGALDAFRAEVEKTTLSPPSIRIISTCTGETLTDAEATSSEYWTRHLRNPVQYSKALVSASSGESSCFIEVGPGKVLTSLGSRQQVENQHFVAALDTARHGDEPTAFWSAVGELMCSGFMPNLEHVFSAACERVRLPGYAFRKERHWLDVSQPTTSERPGVDPNTSADANVDVGVAAATASPKKVADRVLEVFEDVSGLEFSSDDQESNFSELGLDSLFLTQISTAIQNKFQVQVTFRQLVEQHTTINALADFILELSPDVELTGPEPTDIGLSSAAAGDDSFGGLVGKQIKLMEDQLALIKAASNQSLAGAPAAAAATKVSTLVPAPIPEKLVIDRADERPRHLHSESDLDQDRQQALSSFITAHCQQTAKSKAHVQQHRKHHADPRTAAGFNRVWKEIVYPIVVERSKGASMWDLDGNEYIDLLSGFGPNFLGHNHPLVTDAIREQLEKGYEVGPQSPLAGETARLVCELTGFDRASFVCTGSEAVQAALRCARTYTRRQKIVTFEKDYHGNFDEVLYRAVNRGNTLKTLPAAPGIADTAVADVIALPYPAPESLEIVRELGDRLAGVMVEPVQSRRPDLQPKEFLSELRQITQKSGSLLIFDEVVTGFRCHPGGAQAYFGVEADLATYGKVIAGNMPIGIVAGRSAVMDTFDGGQWAYGDDSIPTADVTFFAGTFVRHPLAIVACHALLKYMKVRGPALQAELASKTDRFCVAVNRIFEDFQVPFKLLNFTSVMFIKNQDYNELSRLFWYFLRHHGVYALEGFPMYMTEAHSDAVLNRAVEGFRSATMDMIKAGFFRQPRNIRRDVKRAPQLSDQPPVPGARLGKDPQGRPAWYVKKDGQWQKV